MKAQHTGTSAGSLFVLFLREKTGVASYGGEERDTSWTRLYIIYGRIKSPTLVSLKRFSLRTNLNTLTAKP